MALTEYGTISQRTAAWAAREMLKHAEPIIVLQKMGLTKPVPQNTAEQVKFRRPVPFTVSTVPLAEGVTPSAQQMTYEDVSCTLEQYGQVTTITDKVKDMAEDPALKDVSMLLGEQAAATAEQIVYNAVKAGTSVSYANGSARNAVNTAITLNAIRGVVRSLKNNKAKPITRILSGSPDYNTTPVEGGYVAVCHTDCEADIRGLSGFTPVAEYGTRKTVSDHEFGTVENVRFVTSPDLDPFADAGGAKGSMKSTTGTSADVYPILFFGQDAFACVPLKGKYSLRPIVVNATPSDSDPLAQRNHAGFKFYFASVILNQTWMERLEVAVTDL